MRRFLTAIALLALCASARATPADPANVAESVFVQSSLLNLATGMAWAPDGSRRLFICKKAGAVRVVRDGVVSPDIWAVEAPYIGSECGVIGMAFDPNFLVNRYVYLFVSVAATEQQIIRYVDHVGPGAPATGVGTQRTVLVAGLPTRGANHDGGGLGIGPDGALYWAIGDNGNYTGTNADIASLCAKAGRVNRFTGRVRGDNPFFDGPGPNADAAYARGLRNPFTLAFQPGSWRLWVNSVGTGWEQVFIVNRGDHAGYLTYENNQPAGYLTPVIAYPTGGAAARTITSVGAVRSGGVATFTTSVTHRFRAGIRVTIAGVGSASFNGTYFVKEVLSTMQFTIEQAGPDESSGGGGATQIDFGQCITGGSFYDATAFPPEWHGNFFFGDFNVGQFARVTMNAAGNPASVDLFATGGGGPTDTSTGPDGAIYSVGHGTGKVLRWTTTGTAQNVIVQPTALLIEEGGMALFNVSLAQAPVADVTVSVTKTSGDDDLTIASPATVTFTPANYATPQTVTLAAAPDADRTADTAVFHISAPGIAEWDVQARTIENTDAAPTAAFTAPAEGALVSGSAQVIAGTGGDDDGTVLGEFFIDGAPAAHDLNASGIYAHAAWDTTGLVNGPHALKLRITDTGGQTAEVERAVLVGNGVAAWRAQKFSPAQLADPAISGDLADPEGDGGVNLLEYAFDTAPLAASHERMPQSSVVSVADADYLAVEFVIVKWAGDLIYTVQAASDLAGPWSDIDPAAPATRVAFSDDSPAAGLATVTVRDTEPLGGGARFLRVRVQK